MLLLKCKDLGSLRVYKCTLLNHDYAWYTHIPYACKQMVVYHCNFVDFLRFGALPLNEIVHLGAVEGAHAVHVLCWLRPLCRLSVAACRLVFCVNHVAIAMRGLWPGEALRIFNFIIQNSILQYMTLGRIWQHGRYSYRSWQWFAYNSENLPNHSKSRSVNNCLKCSALDPNSKTQICCQPKLRLVDSLRVYKCALLRMYECDECLHHWNVLILPKDYSVELLYCTRLNGLNCQAAHYIYIYTDIHIYIYI
jgi:hypothetical protein